MLTLEQKSTVYERVEHFVNLANELYNTEMDKPYVRFDKRGTCGGTANYRDMELNFNAGLMLENWDEYMNQVIPHEVAHLVKNHVYGTDRKGRLHSPHGIYWQRIMVAFGCDPARTHSMDTSNVAMSPRNKTKHIYLCTCCNQELVVSAVRHNRVRRNPGAIMYHCNKNHPLTFVRTIGKVTYKEAFEHKKAGTAPKPEVKKAALKRKPSEPKAGTVIARALAVYRAHAGEDRKFVIGQIALTLNITDKRAGQIYQDCKRRSA